MAVTGLKAPIDIPRSGYAPKPRVASTLGSNQAIFNCNAVATLLQRHRMLPKTDRRNPFRVELATCSLPRVEATLGFAA